MLPLLPPAGLQTVRAKTVPSTIFHLKAQDRTRCAHRMTSDLSIMSLRIRRLTSTSASSSPTSSASSSFQTDCLDSEALADSLVPFSLIRFSRRFSFFLALESSRTTNSYKSPLLLIQKLKLSRTSTFFPLFCAASTVASGLNCRLVALSLGNCRSTLPMYSSTRSSSLRSTAPASLSL